MSVPVLYTSTDKIRAALGVTLEEISDAKITDLSTEDQLVLRLDSVFPGAVDLKAAIDAGSPTADQVKQWMILQLYCMYYGAVILLPALQTLIFQQIMDGQTTQSRFQNNNLQDTIDRITARADLYAGFLNPVYEAASSGLGFKLINTVMPLYDPVTNNQDYVSTWLANTDLALLSEMGLGLM